MGLESSNRRTRMKHVVQAWVRWEIWRQNSGQDLVEYALAAGFVASACVAVMPNYAVHISQIFSRAKSVLTKANGS
jgi:Flp pilus assembly pilin Flp